MSSTVPAEQVGVPSTGLGRSAQLDMLDALRSLGVPFTPELVPPELITDIDAFAAEVRLGRVDEVSFDDAMSMFRARFVAGVSGRALVVPARPQSGPLVQARYAGEVAASLRWIDPASVSARPALAVFERIASELAAGRVVDPADMSVAEQLLAAHLARAPRVHVDLVESDVALSGAAAALAASVSLRPGDAAVLRDAAASLTWTDARGVASRALTAVLAERLVLLADVVAELAAAVEPFRVDPRVDALASLAGTLVGPDATRDDLAEAYAIFQVAADVVSATGAP